MSHTLHWPGKYFFYPIGNTSAVCLTRDLAPEQDARVLLLGCGDPRNVLYSIFCEPESAQRRLDFTCCDFDPGVLARNVILLTMFEDVQISLDVIWNIFFHAYLDDRTLEKLVEHCKKLIGSSGTLSAWTASRYGDYLRMCTEQTLADFRRHWQLYIDMHNLPSARLKSIRNAFAQQFKSKQKGSAISSARSAGPVNMLALDVASQHFSRWWNSGVTFGDSQSIASAKHVNPTFAYSLGGEGFNVHYGTDPLVPFHSAPLFGNSKSPVTLNQVVAAAKDEFNQWRKVFQKKLSSPSPPTIRFFSGEATALSKALHALQSTNSLNIGIPVAQWRTHPLVLDRTEYFTHHAPTSFNVIDTSNLDDHIGLLNVLIATAPLLSSSEPSCLYSESLLYEGIDATKEFSTRLHADMTTVGLLVGLHPVDFLSGFTSNSHFHELTMLAAVSHVQRGKSPIGQYHQTITWRRATNLACQNTRAVLPHFDPYQLGSFLYDMYHSLFENEDSMTWQAKYGGDKERFLKAFAQANIIHYIRETFVLFLKLVRDYLQITPRVWTEVMNRFHGLVNMDMTMPMDTMHRQELAAQLYRHGVYTVPFLLDPVRKLGRFADWEVVPPLVRVILLVPKEKLNVFDERDGTPLLHCDILGIRCQNIFSSVHVAYGTVTSSGTRARPRVLFNEDPFGKDGSSPLVVSFVVCSCVLTDLEPQTVLTVNFGVRSTMGTMELMRKLGIQLHVFSAPLLDESSVFLVPESPIPSKAITLVKSAPVGVSQIGVLDDVLVQLDEEFEMVATMSRKVLVEDEVAKQKFGQEQASPVVTQIGPCSMRVAIGDLVQDIPFPYPIMGSKHKARLARKSSYIEIVVPMSTTFKADGMKLQHFPILRANNAVLPWNIHRLNLLSLPSLNSRIPKSILEKWLNPHIGSQMSSRERSLRKSHEDDGIMLVKDTLHSLFVRSTGIQGGAAKRVFAFMDHATKNCDTVIFIHGLKYDLGSHTMVCDGYVLPLTVPLLLSVEKPFGKLFEEGITNIAVYKSEMKVWKHLLPAFVERCRSWMHTANCEYVSQGKIPLTEEMESDPLCSCGRGKDTEGMTKEKLWAPFAPYVTRIAFSPLFAVSYLETVGRDPEKRRCRVCRKKGVKACSGCQKVRYCSPKCQKEDWKNHKPACKS